MRLIVTGASGFLGKRVALALAARGEDVALLARRASVLPEGAWRVLRFDSPDEARRHVEAVAPDVLIHMAAAQGRRGESAAAMVDANVTLGAAILEAMGSGTLFINTGTTLPPEMNLYACTKRQFADLARMLADRGIGPRVANTQLQMIYGPGDDPAKFVPMLALHLARNVGPLVTTPATQRRDFIHIDDVVAAILTLVDARSQISPWQDVPIGVGVAVPLAHFIERAIAVSGFDQPWQRSLPLRAGEPPEMVADTSVLRSLGWRPRVALDDGIGQLIADARTTIAAA